MVDLRDDTSSTLCYGHTRPHPFLISTMVLATVRECIHRDCCELRFGNELENGNRLKKEEEAYAKRVISRVYNNVGFD